MLGLLITLVVWGLVFYVLWWGLGQINLPEPFNKIAKVIIVVAVVIVLLSLLGQIGGVNLGFGNLNKLGC